MSRTSSPSQCTGGPRPRTRTRARPLWSSSEPRGCCGSGRRRSGWSSWRGAAARAGSGPSSAWRPAGSEPGCCCCRRPGRAPGLAARPSSGGNCPAWGRPGPRPSESSLQTQRHRHAEHCHHPAQFSLKEQSVVLLTNNQNTLCSHDWINKLTLKDKSTVHTVADPATFLASNRVLGPDVPLRTACLFTDGSKFVLLPH